MKKSIEDVLHDRWVSPSDVSDELFVEVAKQRYGTPRRATKPDVGMRLGAYLSGKSDSVAELHIRDRDDLIALSQAYLDAKDATASLTCLMLYSMMNPENAAEICTLQPRLPPLPLPPANWQKYRAERKAVDRVLGENVLPFRLAS